MMIAMAQALAFPAVFLPKVTDANQTIYMDTNTGSWYNSVNSLSSPIGSILIGIIMDRFGRRIALATPLFPLILSQLATALSQSNLMLFLSRITIGLCAGCIAPACQVRQILSLTFLLLDFNNVVPLFLPVNRSTLLSVLIRSYVVC